MRNLLFLGSLLVLLAPQFAAADDAALEAIQEYMEFTSYGDGALSAAQVQEAGLASFFIVDARNSEQYERGHMDGAINIEWRQILAHRDELPTDRTLLLYCDTGLLSAKAQFALRIAGFEKAKVLQGGYPAWITASATN
ncbi:MAG: rhodanese-like domain-containing protein [Chromatiaceae bacterium]|nr:rhodanese-like domain-containing protein [Chromatiaceae bacterium]